jgi:hypothetical protein
MSTIAQAALEANPRPGEVYARDNGGDKVIVHKVGKTTVSLLEEGTDVPRTIRISTLYNQYSLVETPKEDKVPRKKATPAAESKLKSGAIEAKEPRTKRELKEGQTWERRSDSTQVTVTSLPDDEETGRIGLQTVDTGRETDSAAKYFRRRFKFVS